MSNRKISRIVAVELSYSESEVHTGIASEVGVGAIELGRRTCPCVRHDEIIDA